MTWMELSSIMLSEISQRKTNIWFHVYVEFMKQINEWKGKNESQTKKQTLNYRDGNWVGGGEGGGCVQQVKGIKERTCCDEHQVMYESAESLYCTSETNITLYVNWNLNKNFLKILK